jgi:hypothetical protein
MRNEKGEAEASPSRSRLGWFRGGRFVRTLDIRAWNPWLFIARRQPEVVAQTLSVPLDPKHRTAGLTAQYAKLRVS